MEEIGVKILMTNSTVSIVVTCYNKEQFISKTFESILLQEWDNIELVLVNDGSTDSTRHIISEFEPKFTKRGYRIIVIDQENQGVAAALRNGLMRIGGEFVCQVDADDELDRRYVSTMAGWLSKNPSYMWAACDALKVRENSTVYLQTFQNPSDAELDGCKLVEQYILRRINTYSWIYMIRTDYLKQCKVVESFYTKIKSGQGPQFIFPLMIGGGKLKYFPIPLYKYNYFDPQTHISHSNSFAMLKDRIEGKIKIFIETINNLPVSSNNKNRLNALSRLRLYSQLLMSGLSKQMSMEETSDVVNILLELANEYFDSTHLLDKEMAHHNPMLLCATIESYTLGDNSQKIEIPKGRIIAWGVLGEYGTSLLPFLKGTILEPNELWDSAGDGMAVKKPNLDSLTADDIVLVLISRTKDIPDSIRASGCNNIVTLDTILTYLSSLIFPLKLSRGDEI